MQNIFLTISCLLVILVFVGMVTDKGNIRRDYSNFKEADEARNGLLAESDILQVKVRWMSKSNNYVVKMREDPSSALAEAKREEKRRRKKRLNKKENALLDQLCEAVICSHENDQWKPSAEACIEDFEKIGALVPLPGVLKIAAEHNLDTYAAALLYHSDKISQ